MAGFKSFQHYNLRLVARKFVFGVSDQRRFKPVCPAINIGKNFEILHGGIYVPGAGGALVFILGELGCKHILLEIKRALPKQMREN